MNKFLILSLHFFLSLPVLAAEPVTDVFVRFRGHHGARANYRLQVGPQEINLNGIAISAHIMPMTMPELAALMSPKVEYAKDCSSGSYFHRVARQSKIQRATGCLESKTAQTLVDSLRKIEGYSYLRRLPAAK